MPRRPPPLLALLGTLAITAAVLALAPGSRTVHAGSPEHFWAAVLNAHQPGFVLVPLDDGGYAYHPAPLSSEPLIEGEGPKLFVISWTAVRSDWQRVSERLRTRAAATAPHDPVRDAFLQARIEPFDLARGPHGFLHHLHQAINDDHLRRGRPARSIHQYHDVVRACARHARYFWAACLFEITWLTGLLWLALWPALRRAKPLRWALHAGLAAVLFVLPAHLGYAHATFIHPRGPRGGVLYPYALQFVPPALSELDPVILSYLPPLLEPLAQDPGPLLGCSHPPGVTATFWTGVLTAAAVFAFRKRVWNQALRDLRG
jgi:hypothetical protein